MRLDAANHGHRLLLTHYWVKGVYLVRIIDATGKRYRGGYVVVEDDLTNPEADRKKINWIIRLRDKVEELQASADPDDADRQGKEIDNQVGDYDYDSIKTPDLDLDDLELPTAEDLLKPLPGDPLDFNPVLDESVFYNIPKAELMMSKQPRQPKPRKPRQIKRDNHFPHYGAETILIRPGDPMPNIPAKHRKKGGPE